MGGAMRVTSRTRPVSVPGVTAGVAMTTSIAVTTAKMAKA